MSQEEESQEIFREKPPTTEVYWRTRRRMTIAAMASIIATMVFAFVTPDMTDSQAELLSSLLWVLATIVGAYMGFRMVEKGFGKRSS